MSSTRGSSDRTDTMMKQTYTWSDVQAVVKKKDAWWTVLAIDPIAKRLALTIANTTNISANQVTILSFVTALAAVVLFYGHYFIAGAIVTQLSFILDCADGTVAKLTGTTSPRGALLDFYLDRLKSYLYLIILGIAIAERDLLAWWPLVATFLFLESYTLILQLYGGHAHGTDALPASERAIERLSGMSRAIDLYRRACDSRRMFYHPSGVEGQMLAFFAAPVAYELGGPLPAQAVLAVAIAVMLIPAIGGTVYRLLAR